MFAFAYSVGATHTSWIEILFWAFQKRLHSSKKPSGGVRSIIEHRALPSVVSKTFPKHSSEEFEGFNILYCFFPIEIIGVDGN